MDNAGQRRGPLPSATAPALSPPAEFPHPPPANESCPPPKPHPPAPAPGPHGFSAERCDIKKASQRWKLSPGVVPGDSKWTILRSAAAADAGCAEITGCSSSEGADVGC